MRYMSNDLISIITPVFNVERYVARCLNSIINQTYTNWELILVNDGSTDNSGYICRDFAQKDKRIIYIEQNNQGQSVARNKALDIAKGKYICFVDSDDWVDFDYLRCLYETIKENNSEIAICAHFLSENQKNILKYVPTDKQIFKVDEFKNKLIKDEIRSFLVDKIFSKEVINGSRFIPGIYYEDYRFYNEILPKLNKDIPVINKPLYYYYQRENSTTHVRKFKHVFDQFNAYKSRFELKYINNDEKAYCLKGLCFTYLKLLQLRDCNKDTICNSKQYILSINKTLFLKAKKLMAPRIIVLFLIAFHFPIIYKFLFNLKTIALKQCFSSVLKLFCDTRNVRN